MPLSNDFKYLRSIAKSFLGDIENRKYSFNGHHCNYLTTGEGERVVLLHGNATTKSYWRQIMQLLAPHFQTIAPDVPGYIIDGLPYWHRFTFKHLSQWLAETLVSVGISENEKCHIVGYCSGAAIAAYYATAYPERVQSLTLLSIPYLYVDAHLSLPERKTILESRWAESEEEFYALLNKTFAEPPYIPAMAVRRYLRKMKDKRDMFNQMVEDTCSSSPLLISRLSQINTPTLAMTGDKDSLSPVEQLHNLATYIPHLQQYAVSNCSHLSLIEQPDLIAERLLCFLKTS